MGNTTISVSNWTKEQLDEIKEKRDHGNFDSVIRELLLVSGTTTLHEELLEKQKELLEEMEETNEKQNFKW